MPSPAQMSGAPEGASPTRNPPSADGDATHAPTRQPPAGVGLALAAEFAILVGLLGGAIGAWGSGTAPAMAGLILFVGIILSGVSFFRLRRHLGPQGPAAGWTQFSFLGVALLALGVCAALFGDAGGFGFIIAAFIASGLLLVGNAIAHLTASVGLARSARLAGVVGIIANATALLAGFVMLAVYENVPGLLATLIGALAIAHVAYVLGLIKARAAGHGLAGRCTKEPAAAS